MSEFYLTRHKFGKEDTCGILWTPGLWLAHTLEDEHRDVKVMHETCIPEGRYRLTFHRSEKYWQRFEHSVIMLTDVPGFSYIYIHPGTTDEDTSGCILVGFNPATSVTGKSALYRSRECYLQHVYPHISAAMNKGECWLTVHSIAAPLSADNIRSIA